LKILQILQKNHPSVPPLNINQNTPNLTTKYTKLNQECFWWNESNL